MNEAEEFGWMPQPDIWVRQYEGSEFSALLYSCPRCSALVQEQHIGYHQAWHEEGHR